MLAYNTSIAEWKFSPSLIESQAGTGSLTSGVGRTGSLLLAPRITAHFNSTPANEASLDSLPPQPRPSDTVDGHRYRPSVEPSPSSVSQNFRHSAVIWRMTLVLLT